MRNANFFKHSIFKALTLNPVKNDIKCLSEFLFAENPEHFGYHFYFNKLNHQDQSKVYASNEREWSFDKVYEAFKALSDVNIFNTPEATDEPNKEKVELTTPSVDRLEDRIDHIIQLLERNLRHSNYSFTPNITQKKTGITSRDQSNFELLISYMEDLFSSHDKLQKEDVQINGEKNDIYSTEKEYLESKNGHNQGIIISDQSPVTRRIKDTNLANTFLQDLLKEFSANNKFVTDLESQAQD